MKVIVIGNPKIPKQSILEKCNGALFGFKKSNLKILHGMGGGSTAIGKVFGEAVGIETVTYKADYKSYGKQCLEQRDLLISREADCAIVFWEDDIPSINRLVAHCIGQKVRIKYVKNL